MSTGNRLRKFVSDRDWRIWFGLVITFIWIGGGLMFVISSVQADPEQGLTLGVIGNFLEGAFAPLAFLWLVLGLFMQQRELANNTEMLRRTSEQSEKQTQAIAATEMNARQETFFKIAESVKHQLGGITGMLFAGGLGPVGSNRYSRDEIADMFQKASSGDTEIFARELMSMEYLEEGGIGSLLYDTEIRRRHTRNYRRTYERLRELARGCDVDGIIVDSLNQSGFGLLYRRMIEYTPEGFGAAGETPDGDQSGGAPTSSSSSSSSTSA
jgi:hypothetical protein